MATLRSTLLTLAGLGLAVLQFACAQPAPALDARPDAPTADMRPPGERYGQTRLLLGVTEGISPELLAALERRYGLPDGEVPAVPELAAYQGAGYRIASAESILDAMTDLAAYRQKAEDELRADLAAIEADHPELVNALDEELLAEEILIVRSAVLDGLEAVAMTAEWPDAWIDPYRTGTLRARNALEYVVFARDMDALADHAIGETTGRLDAFHRLMDDNADMEFMRERIFAAEEMNRQLTNEHRQYATQRTIRTLIFLLPAINRFFRYR